MQIFHVSLAGLTIWLLVRFAPFTLLQKCLLSFGYLFFYEYAAISRNYVLGVLFIFLFCVVYSRRIDAVLIISLILSLLAQTSFYGMLLALLLAFAIVVELFFNEELRTLLILKWKHSTIAILLFTFAIYISLIQIIPPEDTGYFEEWYFNLSRWRIAEAFQIIWKTFIPLHSLDTHFWYQNLLKSFYLQFYFSIILFVVTAIYFIRTPAIFICYIVSILGYVSFSYIKFIGEIRHNGYIFVFFIALLWLIPYFTHVRFEEKYWHWLHTKRQKITSLGSYFLLIILMIHFFSGITAAIIDINYPFSASKDVFKFLKREKLDSKIFTGDKDYALTPIAGYLNRKIYYPRSGDFGTFTIWDKKRKKEYGDDEILKKILMKFNNAPKDKILIFNYEIGDDLVSKYNLKKIAEFKDSIVWDEKFFLYTVKFPLNEMGNNR
jgi:hypothetical protein